MKKWIFGIVLIAFAAIALILLRVRPASEPDIPDEVAELVETYMDAYKKGTEESAAYAHFESDFVRSAYIESGDRLIDYKLESTEKINDNLYSVTLLVKSESSVMYFGDEYQRVYNFTARIENEWYYINGVSDIPPALQENLDVNKYTYEGENIVDPDDIVGKIS